MTFIPCNITILPSGDLAERAISLSTDLQKFNPLFQLSSIGPFAHIAIYDSAQGGPFEQSKNYPGRYRSQNA